MSGRPDELKAEKIKREIIDAVLSLWIEKGEELRFMEIHRALVKKGIVQRGGYRYKTLRILDSLERTGLIDKVGRGKYQVRIEPDQFRLFDRLSKIRRDEDIASLKIGGFLWTACEIHVLGLPERTLDYNYVKTALDILGVRIADIFQALRDLAKETYLNGEKGSLPPRVIRELMLEIPSYYLGSRAGIDGDGLSLDELRTVEKCMLEALPEQVEYDKGWVSSTGKSNILDIFVALSRLSQMNQECGEGREIVEELEEAQPQNFALIMTEAEWKMDEEGYEKRQIIDTIREGSESNKRALRIAHELLLYDKQNVSSMLETWGHKYLKRRMLEVKKFYEQLLASREIARAIEPIVDYIYRKGEFAIEKNETLQRHIKLLMDKAEGYAEKYGTRNMISFLPLHNEFGGLTPEKEKAVKNVFPQVSMELVHEWLSYGEQEAQKLADEALREMEESQRKYYTERKKKLEK